uniref:Cysteine-rich receptor-like protein kinase n=1 Tax=Tanacetum cinerariifolium TaxID=118510 RepID=A0A6L2KJK7_TANCI|nr:cysteine-rich receptor-like protein kinase [Tanacetum cinerariifolium]
MALIFMEIGLQNPQQSKITYFTLSRTNSRKVVTSVVGDVEIAYIKGRQIINGPLMVEEIIAWAKKAKKRLMILKFEFEKDFDSLNWSFLFSILEQMGFSVKRRNWIHSFLNSAYASVLVNGSPTKEFKIKRGLRQGDHLSPFLFILAVEALNVVLLEAINNNVFHGFHIGKEKELKKIISSLETIKRKFFWGGCSEDNKVSWITWDKVIEPCDRGGLSIGSLRTCNQAMLEKWWWRKLGNGQKISFWYDTWLGGLPLCNMFSRLYRLETNQNCLVYERKPNAIHPRSPEAYGSVALVSSSVPQTSTGPMGLVTPPGVNFQWAWHRDVRTSPKIEEFNNLQSTNMAIVGGSILEVMDDLVKGNFTFEHAISSSVGNSRGEIVVLGDFNEALKEQERFGSMFNVQGANVFNNFIVMANLIDLPFPLGGYSYIGNANLLNHRSSLLKDLQDINYIEVLELSQKAKVCWEIEGDENLKYFHRVLNNKRSQLTIRGTLVDGEWITDPSKVKYEFLNHFIKQFAKPQTPHISIGFQFPSRLESERVEDLEHVISYDENKNVVFGNVEIINHHVPTANRLSLVMPDLVSDVQSDFVSNRQILNGPFILNELLSWCKYKEVNAMIFKVDFEKAFGFVRWDYLDDVLNSFSFGEKLRKWDPSNIKIIVHVLRCFYLALGLTINLHKSKHMGIGINKEEVDLAAAIVGCSMSPPL